MSERDKYLTEAMGECWHEDLMRGALDYAYCPKCESDLPENGKPFNISLSTWEGFGKLWEFCQKQEWYIELVDKLNCDPKYYFTRFIHPDRFADAVYKFLKERENETANS